VKWVTRAGAKVDRIACPWLIRRFVDPQAEFLFVPADQVEAVARREGATPFDVPGARLGHRGQESSFDAIVREYGIEDPAVLAMAKIVRAADVKSQAHVAPEGAGLIAIADGFRRISKDDHENLARQSWVYDAIYASLQARLEKSP
jgi:hypothetical protein